MEHIKQMIESGAVPRKHWLTPEEAEFVSDVVQLERLHKKCNDYLNGTTHNPEEWQLFEFNDIKEILLDGTPVPDVNDEEPMAREFTPTELQLIAEWIAAGKQPRNTQVGVEK